MLSTQAKASWVLRHTFCDISVGGKCIQHHTFTRMSHKLYSLHAQGSQSPYLLSFLYRGIILWPPINNIFSRFVSYCPLFPLGRAPSWFPWGLEGGKKLELQRCQEERMELQIHFSLRINGGVGETATWPYLHQKIKHRCFHAQCFVSTWTEHFSNENLVEDICNVVLGQLGLGEGLGPTATWRSETGHLWFTKGAQRRQ